MENILNSLNEVQKRAVTTTEGPLLVLAGAGTGKTKVLTSRIGYIIKNNLAYPYQILAVTFTNKAALEMRERINSIIFGFSNDCWVGTFHSIGLRILRRYYENIGLKKNFIILDSDDVLGVIKGILLNHNIDIKVTSPRIVASKISELKNKVIFPDNIPYKYKANQKNLFNLEKIYKEYTNILFDLNAVDFDDLLLLCIKLFENKGILARYQNQFKYILVDEFQDTNTLQYKLLKKIAAPQNNLCCVGDDDQSIYSWRGAKIENILNFHQEFKDCKSIKLEQNYRSTTPILATASCLIKHNEQRLDKTLWSTKEDGNKVIVNECVDNSGEIKFLAEQINNLKRECYNYKDIAILVRAAYQTLNMEKGLPFYNIPFKLVGLQKFFERQEIKDILAYLRLVYQYSDNIAFERIINTPKRGVGNKTLEDIKSVAKEHNTSYFDATQIMLANDYFTEKTRHILQKFINQISSLKNLLDEKETPLTIAETMLEDIGYIEMWENIKKVARTKGNIKEEKEAADRLENIKELLDDMYRYNTLEDYLDKVSLMVSRDDANNDEKVSIMTIHASKGLEFGTVFLVGWEEGTFPSPQSLNDNIEGLEEERRLAYVAITRAKENLMVSYARKRTTFSGMQERLPSRFIEEMGTEHINFNKQQAYDSMLNRQNEYSRSSVYYYCNNKNFVIKENINAEEDIKKTSPVITDDMNIIKGKYVQHKLFGKGRIVKTEGPILHILFDENGLQKIPESFFVKV